MCFILCSHDLQNQLKFFLKFASHIYSDVFIYALKYEFLSNLCKVTCILGP